MFSKHIFILLLFFTIVFILSELYNLLDKYTSDFAIKSLLIKDLNYILKYRGIKYRGLFEKRELLNLISETGQTSKHELLSATTYAENEGKCNQTSISIIPSEDLFNELVEDSKDSAWILMTILPKSSDSFSDQHNKKLEDVWCHVQSIYAKFGVNMAVLDCGYLYNLCWDRGFHRSPFVLVLPRGRVKIKDSVDFFVFPYSTDLVKETADSIKKSVIDWLRKKLAHRVNQEFVNENPEDSKTSVNHFPVHFVSIYSNKSGMQQMPPTSISAHSVKFTGRIHFWSGLLNDIPKGFTEKIVEKYPNWSPPGHFFIGKNNLLYQYGKKEGQSINYEALQLFFRDLCPNSNDLFIWILLIINLMISFQFAIQNGSFALKLGYYIWYLLVFNLLYCSIFLSLLSFLNFSYNFNGFIQFASSLWQKIAISSMFEHIRYLQLNNKLNLYVCSSVWILITAVIVSVPRRPEPETEQSDSSPTSGITPSSQFIEPWDPEAGQQIALLTSLGNFNLTLPQQPPFYLSKLLIWSFQAPQKWACKLANKCKDSKMAAKISTLCDVNKTSGHDDSDLSSDLSSNDANNYSSLAPESQMKAQWPKGYIFTKKCCICLERFRQNEILCGLPCGHAFHNDCIKRWLVQRAKDDCPQCRWPAYKEKP